MRAIAGGNAETIFHAMDYAEGLGYSLLWWQDKIAEVEKFDALLRCITGSGSIRKIDVLTMNSTREGALV